MAVRFAVNMVGNRELGAKLNKIIKRIDKETENTLTRMANETLLYGMMVAPRRTGATALSIKQDVKRKQRTMYMEPIVVRGFPYNINIDKGKVPKKWGEVKAPGMTDMRSRKDKLHFFVGSESIEGKTLKFAKKNFKRHVDDLGRAIAIS